jgi:CRISPR-associated endonuclease/helicase Cas3
LGTAKRAAEFAEPFGAEDLGEASGLLHDVGKCSQTFSSYLKMCADEGDEKAKAVFRSRDHKMAGALLASETNPNFGDLLSMVVLGHHGGLANRDADQKRLEDARTNKDLLRTLTTAQEELPLPLIFDNLYPDWFKLTGGKGASALQNKRDAEMYMRFVFSALVDADWLDTESHFSPGKSKRRAVNGDIPVLLDRFNERRDAFMATATSSPVNEARTSMYDQVLESADLPPGLYKLSAPTGAGKTLIALGWALSHAKSNNLRRIVTAVPFISVTDQVAAVYRDFLDSEEGGVVIEHHSQVADGDGWQRLASENWDSPVVVTTNVRLFESLFSNRTSDCRRLHRLAKSVIVLDEVQALPIELMEPIVDALRSLVTRFGATILLLTATQPTLQHIPSSGDLEAVELMPDMQQWGGAFQRTKRDWVGSLDHAGVAALMAKRSQCLCVVNTIHDAELVTSALGDKDSIHLSTHLRPLDRRARLQEIRDRLDAGEPCKVVSTQLVEAGVDLDFPTVLRALAPLPSMLQADGRCNRNGLMKNPGEVIFFDLEGGKAPTGAYYTIGNIHSLSLLGDNTVDAWSPEGIEMWYEMLLNDDMVKLDSRSIQTARQKFRYKETASLFTMINDDTESVVVPLDSSSQKQKKTNWILSRLRNGDLCSISDYRELQDLTISLRTWQIEKCLESNLLVKIGSADMYEWIGRYDKQMGVLIPRDKKGQ